MKSIKKIFLSSLVLIFTIALVGCNHDVPEENNTPADGSADVVTSGKSSNGTQGATGGDDGTTNPQTEAVYTITFDANGHGTAPDAMTGKHKDEVITLPDALTTTTKGFTFEKWNNGITDYDVGASYTVTGDITFTAKWNVAIENIEIESIYISSLPEQTEYLAEDCFDASKVVVKAKLKDSTEAVISNVCTITTDLDSVASGLNKNLSITATCGKFTATETMKINKASYKLHQSPVAIAEPSDASLSGVQYYEFGDFPKTVNLDSGITYSEKLVMDRYYIGSDGNLYEAINVNPFRAYFKFVSNSGTKVGSGLKYFKVEPLVWRTLSNDGQKALLLCETIVRAGISFYESTEARQTSLNQIIDACNYEYSRIRAYLNGYDYLSGTSNNSEFEDKGFLQIAFTSAAQEKIVKTTFKNDEASATPAGQGTSVLYGDFHDDLSDKIFLLSAQEWTNTAYGFLGAVSTPSKDVSTNRKLKYTDYALSTGVSDGCHTGMTRSSCQRIDADSKIKGNIITLSDGGWIYPHGNTQSNNPNLSLPTACDTGIIPAMTVIVSE